MIAPRTRALVDLRLIGSAFDCRAIQPLVEKYDLSSQFLWAPRY
jgi:hypothetical protein